MSDFALLNGPGHRVSLRSLGAAIAAIWVPDANGRNACVSVDTGGSSGKTIGRYANRIAGAAFSLDGTPYRLAANEGRNALHGGANGFSKRDWQTGERMPSSLEFVLHSPDGDQGFPGALECRVLYRWSDQDALRLDYTATTQRPTVVNLTNHVYFNLTGDPSASIAQHELSIRAAACTPVDEESIPTGAIAPVAGTSRDFRAPRPIGSERFDVNFVLDGWDGTLRPAARVRDPATGRTLSVETTEPGLQLFTGKPGAFALETQHFADAPNRPNFPSTVLRPGETFRSTTIYRFGT